MTTGRIAVLAECGPDFELREDLVPEPEPGAIMIRLTRAGVRGSDLHILPLARITEAVREAEWKQRGADGLRLSRAALSMVD